MKKAQGLSMTTIIVAALAVIVLIVLIAIFTGRIGNFGEDIDTSVSGFKGKCELPGTNRKCTTETYCNSTYGGQNIGDYDCTSVQGQICCEY